MKKFKVFSSLILPLIIPLFSSCSVDEKIDLIFGDMYNEDVEEISYSELSTLIDDKYSFVLVTMPVSNCTCWATFRRILSSYIEEYHVTFYAISYSSLNSAVLAGSSSYGIDYRSDQQTFTIFDEGVLKVNLTYTSSNKIFSDYDAFVSYMEETINLPKIYYINETQLDNLYSQDEDFIIYFNRSLCSDCKYINKNFLKEFVSENLNMDKIYAFDGELVREYENGELSNEEEWQEFKDKYGLSSSNNEKYGYEEGFTPSFYLISPDGENTNRDVIKSGLTYLNDVVSKDASNNYYVETSFYSEDRLSSLEFLDTYEGTKVLEGLSLSEDEISDYDDYIVWNNESASEYHDPLLTAFLEHYAFDLSDDFLI